LHSAAGDSMTILARAAARLRKRRGKLVVFIGNEYDLMAEKLAFLRDAGADYVCSQLPIKSARWLYAEVPDTEVLEMPPALNPCISPPPSVTERPVDLGFAGAMYPLFVGDVERTRLIRGIEASAPARGLRCDIRETKLNRAEWAAFLGRCKGTVGGEAGT